MSNICFKKVAINGTYEFLILAAVVYPDIGLAGLVKDLEGEMLDIRLHLGVGKLASNETLGVEYSVVGIHGDLVLCGVADQPLVVREGDIRRCCPVTLVVGNDFDSVVLPDTNTSTRF